MASRDPKDLTPEMQVMYLEFSRKMAEAKLRHKLTCTARILHEQIALYVQGRKMLLEVNEFRRLANLPPITKQENKIVTWTVKSKHVVRLPGQKARAFDIVLLKGEGGEVHWNLKANINDNEIPDYEEAGIIGESCGLKWGGRFSSPDYVHFEQGE